MVPKILSRLTLVSLLAIAGLRLSANAEDEKEKHGAYRYRQHDFDRDDRDDRHGRHQDRHNRWHHRNQPTHPFYYRHDNRPYRHYDSYSYDYRPYSHSYYQQRNDGCSFIYDFYGRIMLVCN